MKKNNIIDIRNLTREFQNGEENIKALNDVSFTIKEGEFVAIIGPSGSGKSTLLNILGCMDTPTSGKYILNDESVTSDSDLPALRLKNIGFIFQSFNLLPKLSSHENVELPMLYSSVPKKLRAKKAVELLIQVGLEDRIYHPVNKLSGGQKQRVAIARALANEPKILLADEPTGNLDTKTTENILELLKSLNSQGVTLIVVTHEDFIANSADRIITIKDGKIEKDIRK